MCYDYVVGDLCEKEKYTVNDNNDVDCYIDCYCTC